MPQLGNNVRIGSNVRLGTDPDFKPTWISGCVAWFDMADLASYARSTSTTVSTVTNKVSGAVWATPSSDCPYESGGINGRPCLHPTTVSHRITSTEADVLSTLYNNPDYTLICVTSFDAADANGAIFGAAITTVGTTDRRYWGQNTSSTGRMISQTIDSSAVTINAIGTLQTTTTPTVYVWSSPQNAVSSWVNGTPDLVGVTQNPSSLIPTQVGLFAVPDNSADTPLVGRFGELLLFNRRLSDFEIATITIHLHRKWGIVETTPLNILGSLAWWLRADQGITLATGVSQWSDLSGNGVTFSQGTGTNQPSFVSNAINGRPAVRGDGVNDLLNATFPRSAPGTQPFFVWLIYKGVTFTNGDYILGDLSGAGMVVRQLSPDAISVTNGAGIPSNSGIPTGSYGRIEILAQNSSGDYLKCSSSSTTGSNIGNSAGAGTLQLFSSGASASPANVEIAEAFWFRGIPSTYQKAYLDAYAYLRYGPTLLI
jgi:hypothetical protein